MTFAEAVEKLGSVTNEQIEAFEKFPDKADCVFLTPGEARLIFNALPPMIGS